MPGRRHAGPESGGVLMSERIRIASTRDVPPGGGVAVAVEGLRIAVFHVDGRYYAIDDRCPHAEASLAEGDVDGTVVECPLHGAQFDLTTGRALSGPAGGNVAAYRVHVEGEDLSIEVT